MRVVLIAALASNRVIGRDADLPWRLPDDWKHFKKRTLGLPVVMGRKTWESLPKPLAKRTNIVVTRQADYQAEGARVTHSLRSALELAAETGSEEVAIIGGASIYQEAMPLADELVLTHVEAEVEGDTLFPEVDWQQWAKTRETSHPADDKHAFAFRIACYERRH